MNTTRILRQDAIYPEEILREAAAISEARSYRIQQLTSLGLSVPDDPSGLVTARSRASVDNMPRQSRDSEQRLKRAIARCRKRAVRAS
jgi:hypothetical protein